MARRLVIVRHAKTQSRREGLADLDRRLTEAGARSCAARLPLALGLMSHSRDMTAEPLAVWSSPANRALQTAAIAADALGIDRIEEHDSLYADSPGPFLSELSDARGTIVAVGHNPFLEDLYRLLSGTGQELGKGAVASFVFGADGTPRLEWFVQGPDHRRWKTLVELESALRCASGRVLESRAAFLRDPVDAETLHQYRISLRVTRSLVQFLRPYLKEKPASRAEGALKLLARETSSLRELDVFACEARARGLSGAQDGRLVLELEIERNAARAALVESLGCKRGRKLLGRVMRFCKHPAWKRSLEEDGLAAEELASLFDAAAAAYHDDLAVCDFEDAEATHDVRKRSKRLRYVARELGELLGEGRGDEGKAAKEMQDRLGKICDARVNGALAERFGLDALAVEERERAEALVHGLGDA